MTSRDTDISFNTIPERPLLSGVVHRSLGRHRSLNQPQSHSTAKPGQVAAKPSQAMARHSVTGSRHGGGAWKSVLFHACPWHSQIAFKSYHLLCMPPVGVKDSSSASPLLRVGREQPDERNRCPFRSCGFINYQRGRGGGGVSVVSPTIYTPINLHLQEVRGADGRASGWTRPS